MRKCCTMTEPVQGLSVIVDVPSHANIVGEQRDRPQSSNTCYFTVRPIPSGEVIAGDE